MKRVIQTILGGITWLCAGACLVTTALYADGLMPVRYAWAFGMIFLIAMLTLIFIEGE